MKGIIMNTKKYIYNSRNKCHEYNDDIYNGRFK